MANTTMPARVLQTIPVTLTVSFLAVLASMIPSVGPITQLEFSQVEAGQWWRIWTGHLTHFDTGHLCWDLLMFVVLAAACERRHASRFAPSLIVMAAGISVAISILCRDVDFYRGLSGLDTGLFVWFIADQIRDRWCDGKWSAAVLWSLPAMALMSKLMFEAVTGNTLFVDSSHFVPLVESHLAGSAMGLLVSQSIAAMPTPRHRSGGAGHWRRHFVSSKGRFG